VRLEHQVVGESQVSEGSVNACAQAISTNNWQSPSGMALTVTVASPMSRCESVDSVKFGLVKSSSRSP
jgi:hypothetical protein